MLFRLSQFAEENIMDTGFVFEPEKILELSKNILRHDVLSNIGQYNDEMTISQVVRFFERHGLDFTKTMIQNYVRVGVLPPPVDKRYYVKNHLILLTLIHHLKDIYSLDDIKRLLHPVSKDLETFEDDVIDVAAIYDIYIGLCHRAIHKWEKELPELIATVRDKVDNRENVYEGERDTVYFFITVLTLMAQSIATKQLARMMLDTYNEKPLDV